MSLLPPYKLRLFQVIQIHCLHTKLSGIAIIIANTEQTRPLQVTLVNWQKEPRYVNKS